MKREKKGKNGEWKPNGRQSLTEVEENEYDTRTSHYSTQTAKEEDWGLISKQKEWEYSRYQDADNLELSSVEWKWEPQKANVDDSKKTLGFGEYHDLSYAEVLMYKYPKAQYLMGDQDEQRPAKKKFPEWAKMGEWRRQRR